MLNYVRSIVCILFLFSYYRFYNKISVLYFPIHARTKIPIEMSLIIMFYNCLILWLFRELSLSIYINKPINFNELIIIECMLQNIIPRFLWWIGIEPVEINMTAWALKPSERLFCGTQQEAVSLPCVTYFLFPFGALP